MVEPAKNADNSLAIPECVAINSNISNYSINTAQEMEAPDVSSVELLVS